MTIQEKTKENRAVAQLAHKGQFLYAFLIQVAFKFPESPYHLGEWKSCTNNQLISSSIGKMSQLHPHLASTVNKDCLADLLFTVAFHGAE